MYDARFPTEMFVDASSDACFRSKFKADNRIRNIHNKKFEFDLSCGAPENWQYSVVIAIPLLRDEESHNLENQKMGTVVRAANRGFVSSQVAIWSKFV
jgi:hypothetical protein